jgi:hypothetical protein
MSLNIRSYEQWLTEYKKDKHKIWIKAVLDNNAEFYLSDHKEWLDLKLYCDKENKYPTKVSLQYRSHSIEVDVSKADGVYLVRSLIGMMGQDSKQTITIGKVIGGIVHKTMWVTPELLEDLKSEDPIEECFKEALILKNVNKEAGTV